jgi:hypothetical protein
LVSADHGSEVRGVDGPGEGGASRPHHTRRSPGGDRLAVRACGEWTELRQRGSDRLAPPCRRSKRHEGTDRGDAVRLSTRSSSKGVNSVARTRSATREQSLGLEPAKRGEHPTGSGAQQTRKAKVEQAVQAVQNCEGGTGADGRHRSPEGDAKASPGVDTEAHVGGDDQTTEPTRGGFASPAREESSEGEAKRGRSRHADPATDLGCGASRKDLEGATGNDGTPGRERGGQRTATGTTRYERNTVASPTSNRRPTS